MTPTADPEIAARACPGCAAPMRRQSFARRPAGNVDLDLCFGCQAIWFDAFESPQLAPLAVLELFEAIHAQRDRPPRPIDGVLHCVTCRGSLQITHDIMGTNHIVYYRCVQGHGRFTTFMQFLREKSFVRSLSPVEIDRLKASVAQVRCSSCGAPVDIANDACCAYCHAPIAILDADAVRRTFEELGQKGRRRHDVDPSAILDALLAGQRTARGPGATGSGWGAGPVDLVHEALAMLTRVS